MQLKDQVVVITGSTKGFGLELAKLLLAEGSKIVISSHNKEHVDKVAVELGVLGVVADVTKDRDVENLANQVEEKLGPIDIWVNNAGLWLSNENAENNDLAKVKAMVDVNVTGLFNGSIIALRKMKPKNSGILINILSGAALGPRPGIVTYSATKWAGKGLTDGLREENKDTGLKFITICPGGMKTTIFGEYHYANFDQFLDPAEVAQRVIDNLKLDNPENEMEIRRKSLYV